MAISALLIGGMKGYGAMRAAAVPTVETVTLERQTVKETVVCAGTVTASEGIEVYAPMPCVAGEIAVAVGDRVNEGDVLLTVDRTATLAMAVSAGLPAEQSAAASAALPLTVTAPSSGVVSAVGAASGDVLATDAPCVVLSEGDGVTIAIALKEKVLPRMQVGQEVTVSGVAFDKKEYKAVLSKMATSARTRMSGSTSETVVDAVVTFAPGEADESLMVGLSAKAAITVDSRDDVLLVPYDCVAQDDDGDPYVYCLRDGEAHKTAVILGEELTQGAVVKAGLDAGDTVIVKPDALSGERAAVRTEDA